MEERGVDGQQSIEQARLDSELEVAGPIGPELTRHIRRSARRQCIGSTRPETRRPAEIKHIVRVDMPARRRGIRPDMSRRGCAEGYRRGRKQPGKTFGGDLLVLGIAAARLDVEL